MTKNAVAAAARRRDLLVTMWQTISRLLADPKLDFVAGVSYSNNMKRTIFFFLLAFLSWIPQAGAV